MQTLTLVQTVIITSVVSALWFDLGKTGDAVDDRRGVVFFTTVYWSFQAMFGALTSLPAEIEVIKRERAVGAVWVVRGFICCCIVVDVLFWWCCALQSGSYRLSAYFFARTVVDLPLTAAFPTMYLIVMYFCVGLRQNVGSFFTFWAVFMLTVYGARQGCTSRAWGHLASRACVLCACVYSLAAEALGAFISAVCGSRFRLSLVSASLLMLTMMLTGGFYTDSGRIPAALEWFSSRLSFVTYSFAALVRVEFGGRTLPCVDAERVDFPCPVRGDLVADENGGFGAVGWDALGLAALASLFRIAGYFALRHRTAVK